MESFDKKRSRSQNWDDMEKYIFMECVKEELKVIENKSKVTVLNNDKAAAWERVSKKMEVQGNNFYEEDFSSVQGYSRDCKRLREQWQRMKVQAKRSIGQYRRQCNATGGGPPVHEPSDIDYKIQDLLPHEFVQDASSYDSDAICNTQTKVALEESDLPNIFKRKKVEDVPVLNSILNVGSPSSESHCHSIVETKSSSSDLGEIGEVETGFENGEEIVIIVKKDEDTTNKQTPKRKITKKMSSYEQKLYELNMKRMETLIAQSKEMHEMKMQHQKEMHDINVQNEMEKHNTTMQNEMEYHDLRMRERKV